MFLIPLLAALLAQGLFGSAYVVVEEENGYYRTWRANSPEQRSNPWSSFTNPQNYFPFLQNINPFSWWQSQQSIQDNSAALNVLYERQKFLFNILRCLADDESKLLCKHLIGNSGDLFPESVHVNEIWFTKPEPSKFPSVEQKPVDADTTILIAKPCDSGKPIEIEFTTVEVNPSTVESATPNQVKPTEVPKPTVIELVSEIKPVEIEASKPVLEDIPKEIEKNLSVEAVNIDSIEVKPIGTTLIGIKPLEIKPVETKPIDTEHIPITAAEIKPEPIEVKPIEAKPVEINPLETKPVETKPIDIEQIPITPSEIKPEPIEVKPIEEKPVEIKPVEATPIDTEPIKATEIKSTEIKPEPIEVKPIETEDTPIKIAEIKPETVEVKPVEAEIKLVDAESEKAEIKLVETSLLPEIAEPGSV